jgi:general secretion pathway protein E
MTVTSEPLASVDLTTEPECVATQHYDLVASTLVERGKLKKSDINRVKKLSLQTENETLPLLLVKLGLISERDASEAIASVSGLPLVDTEGYPPSSPLPENISQRFLKSQHIVGLAATEECITLGIADPFNQSALSAIQMFCRKPISLCIGIASEIEKALDIQFGSGKSLIGDIIDHFGSEDDINQDDVEHLKDLASEAPVIRMVNFILQRAVELRASDIHVEPFEQKLKIRFRIDGVLREIEAPPLKSSAAVISRIKIMAKLNIAERRLPQDGRIKLQVQGKQLDLRVSTTPTMFGESVVIRLLDKESIRFDFQSLGFDGAELSQFLEVLGLPHGIILITGPTGSGKSTTLYTALHKINTVDRKIITVEDPVEYQLEGINQIQVKPQIGLTFANALRSIMRQDPDVIMIGEMRDLETGRIAVQAALTGHLVLSTLHTNNAASGVTRLLDMGLEDYLITSTVSGILGQRLVRKLCQSCKQPVQISGAFSAQLQALQIPLPENGEVFEAKGCPECDGSGYKGRLCITEFLVMNDTLRQLIMDHTQASIIEEKARALGMHTMYQDGIRKAIRGLTTIDEVLRVTAESQ